MVFGGNDQNCERDLDITGLDVDETNSNILITAQSYKKSGYDQCPMDPSTDSEERRGIVALIDN